jgi:hypothetical protein
MQMYSLRLPSDEKSNLSKSLAAICSYGKPGQLLISAGTNKDSWNMFLAKLTCHMVSKGATEQDVYAVLNQIAAGNASQARQKLELLMLQWLNEDGTPDAEKNGTREVLPPEGSPAGTKPTTESKWIPVKKVWGGTDTEILTPGNLLKFV